eukprot:5286273-Pyramimonas_sp.AAC.1
MARDGAGPPRDGSAVPFARGPRPRARVAGLLGSEAPCHAPGGGGDAAGLGDCPEGRVAGSRGAAL